MIASCDSIGENFYDLFDNIKRVVDLLKKLDKIEFEESVLSFCQSLIKATQFYIPDLYDGIVDGILKIFLNERYNIETVFGIIKTIWQYTNNWLLIEDDEQKLW
jgi:hypothetical protein